MALSHGLRAGLAQVGQWDQQINDLRQNEVLNNQAKLLAEKKAALFADDFDYNNAMNTHDNPLVKEFAQTKIREIGSFVNQNPDWETNVGKRAQYKQLIRELKDNPDLNRGMQSDANYTQFSKDLAEKSKNPDLFDAGAYNDVMQQWRNYEKYGNQYATSETDAAKLGKKAFVYQQPQDWNDLNKEGMEYGNKFNDFEIQSLPGGFVGSYREVPKEQSLNALSSDFYARNKRQMDLRYKQAGYRDPIEYAKALIRPGIKTKFDMGDASASLGFAKLRQEGEAKAPALSSWKIDVGNTKEGVVPGYLLKEAFGATPPLRIMSDDGTKELDLTGREVDYSGFHQYIDDEKRSGVKRFQVQTKLTKEEAEQMGILDNNWLSSDEIKPEWRKKAKVEKMTDKEGKEREYVSITVMQPFNINSASAAGIFDKKVQVSKNVPEATDNYQTTKPKTVSQGGIVYTLNEQTGNYE